MARIFTKRRCLAVVAAFLLLAGGAFAALWAYAPDPLEALRRRPVSPVLLDDSGAIINARLSLSQEWCLPIPLSEMGQWLPLVLVAVEDRRFYQHPGIDPLAIGRAAFQNLTAGRVRSGASTITSQLARISAQWQDGPEGQAAPKTRTLSLKLVEFVSALKLECSLSKEQILEKYLNSAPFGGVIRGAEAAARLYFGKRAKELSLGEAALLVGMLKGPTAYRPDRNPKAALRRRQMIINMMAERTEIDPIILNMALAEPLPSFNASMPSRAWHFADMAYEGLSRRGGQVPSTLNMAAQERLERILLDVLPPERPFFNDPVTAAAIIVDNRTASIIAYVGNARFQPGRDAHWVDCARAPRSPGSTLKPFVYLDAMEQGLIIPASLLADTPLNFSGGAPRNFDRRYRGPVSAGSALANSLNAPAVRVQRLIGVARTLQVLRRAGFTQLRRDDGDYGDSLVLGAGEVTLLELARAYSTLARLGQDRPLSMSAAETADSGGAVPGRQLYSPEAAYLVAEILRDPARLPWRARLEKARHFAPASFKTGTSFGFRDAWTVAYTPEYTVAVWFGRESGGAEPMLTGLRLAAPVALEVLRTLEQPVAEAGKTSAKASQTPRTWYVPPLGLEKVSVCPLSGRPPSAFCPITRQAWRIKSVARTVPCKLHVLKNGKTALEWPPELEDFTRKRLAREDLSRSAFISSPIIDARYLITPGGKLHPIPLKAEGVDYPVHWYADGVYLGKQERANLPLYWMPVGGTHNISLLDAKDRISVRKVEVTDLSAVVKESLQ